MLEVRHLTKIYRQKKGKEVRALDDVSVSFGDTGLVFILGKSGCGKSTFLNIAGGLDAPTSGEVVVMGKSSKDFKPRDFDAYRNTYVGFVFQEYNILEEFTVEDNIALALQLQRQDNIKERVQDILKELDMEEFAKRKPNALSGGQRQRIAIARALIKNPQIIMADEPTGALDSNTGRQVLDTLKALSSTRLVIVVTHDREFAETYGDRIIELKDGKVISDISRIPGSNAYSGASSPEAAAVRWSAMERARKNNIQQVERSVQALKSGASLTQEDLDAIQRFIRYQQEARRLEAEAGAEANTEAGAEAVSGMWVSSKADMAVNKVASAEEDGTDREVIEGLPSEGENPNPDTTCMPAGFCTTEELQDAGNASTAASGTGYGGVRLISSRLPYRTALKMGAMTLKCKPVRLAFTILLSLVAFVVFGLLSCFMTYNDANVAAKSFYTGTDHYMDITKYYKVEEVHRDYIADTVASITYDIQSCFTDEDIDYLGLENYLYGGSLGSSAQIKNISTGSAYYSRYADRVLYAPADCSVRDSISCGKYPEQDDEVCISTYLADGIMYNGILTDDVDEDGQYIVVYPDSYDSLLGQELDVNGLGTVFISGIFDAGEMPDSIQSMLNDGLEGQSGGIYVSGSYTSGDTANAVSKSANSYTFGNTISYNGYSSGVPTEFGNYIDDGIYMSLLMTRNAVDTYCTASKPTGDLDLYGSRFDYASQSYSITAADYTLDDETWSTEMRWFMTDNNLGSRLDCIMLDGTSRTLLQYNETILPLDVIYSIVSGRAYDDESGTSDVDVVIEYASDASDADGAESAENTGSSAAVTADEFLAAASRLIYGYCIRYDESSVPSYSYLTDSETAECESIVTSYLADNPVQLVLQNETVISTAPVDLTIAGYYYGYDAADRGAYVSYVLFSELSIDYHTDINVFYETPEDAIYTDIIMPVEWSESALRTLMSRLNSPDDITWMYFYMNNSLYRTVLSVNSTISTVSAIFLAVGIIFAVFAALLLFNFISASISAQNREIGILRAVGARGTDVFKIFFSESAIVVIACWILSIIVTAIMAAVINAILLGSYSLPVTIVIFGPLSVLMMLGIAIVVAFLGTFLPVYNASRRRPAESIRAL